jgi:hypothetical protein
MENNRQVFVNLDGPNRQVARHPDRAQSSGLRQARHCQSSSATETRQSPASGHHPTILRLFARNHPFGCASLTMGSRRKSTDNAASFPPESSDAPAEMVRDCQATQPYCQIVETAGSRLNELIN